MNFICWGIFPVFTSYHVRDSKQKGAYFPLRLLLVNCKRHWTRCSLTMHWIKFKKLSEIIWVALEIRCLGVFNVDFKRISYCSIHELMSRYLNKSYFGNLLKRNPGCNSMYKSHDELLLCNTLITDLKTAFVCRLSFYLL